MRGKMGDSQRLLHILEAIDEIHSYTLNTDLTTFLSNSMMRFACVKQIEIIGEAANYFTPRNKGNVHRFRMETDYRDAAHSCSRILWR